MGHDPDWLPEGWEVSVRVRGSGKRDKYYINLSNGLKYNSKPEVLRYLKNARKKHEPKELKSMDNQFDIVVKKIVADNLPPGWIKEIRTKKKSGKIRRDPAAAFEAGKYLSRNNLTIPVQVVTKPGEPLLAACSKGPAISNNILAEENPSEQKEEVANSPVAVNTVGEHGNVKKELKNSPVCEANKNVARDYGLDPGSRDAAEENKTWNVPNEPPLPTVMEDGDDVDKKRLSSSDIGSRVDVEDHTSQSETSGFEKGENDDSLSVVFQDTPPQIDGNNEKVARRSERKRSSGKWMNDFPRRTSKRLTRVEADSSLEVKTRNNDKAIPCLCDSETNPSEKVVNCNSAIDNKQEELDPLPFGGDEKHEKHLDSSLNNLLMDPCIAFAIITLTGVVPVECMNRVEDSPVPSHLSPNQIYDSGFSPVFPPGDLWSDPCFEFAVKTLTGEIPMECSSHTLVSFEHRLSSSGSSYFTAAHFNGLRPVELIHMIQLQLHQVRLSRDI